jgi:hypothetical protein
MPLQIYMHTRDRRQLTRKTSRSWQPDEDGWISWGTRSYRVDPDYFERLPYRPIWHFMFLLPLLLLERPERMSIHFNVGDPQPRNMQLDPVLDNLVTTGTAEGIHRIGKQRTVNDFTFPRKSDPIMMILILSVAANIALAIGLAIKSVAL